MLSRTVRGRPSAPGGPAPGAPARADGLTGAALGLVVLYGALRVHWQSGHMPEHLSPVGPDLVVFTGWWAVVLCALAALALTVMMTARLSGLPRRSLLVGAGAVSTALVAAGALLLLDVVGGILPGLGVGFYPLGALSRAACVGSGILLGRAARTYRRGTRPGCAKCGSTETSAGRLDRTPGWAFWAAYAAVAGCLVRIIAQVCVGFDESPFAGGVSMVLFEIGFLLGGLLLPPALVHGWGRVWPRWVPGLAGRPVPRRLVLWPAVGVSGGLVVYFGLMFLTMVFERLNGRAPFPPEGGLDLPEIFFWAAVPGYLIWGAGMAVATLAYARRTRLPCGACGR
ncbi:hypothetical protein [Streptosporangium sp. NPDC003464]